MTLDDVKLWLWQLFHAGSVYEELLLDHMSGRMPMPQQDYYIRSYRLRRKCLGSARKAFDLTVLEIEKELE